MLQQAQRLAVAAIGHHLEQAGLAFEVKEDLVTFADHRLQVDSDSEGFVQQGELTLAPLEIAVRVDGDSGDRFRIGTLGVGADRTAALHAAISEWHMLALVPLMAALDAEVDKRRSTRQQLGGWEMFPGRVGVRGSIPPKLRDGQFHRVLMEPLGQTVASWPTPPEGSLRSIFLMVSGAATGTEVQAAVDGLLDEELVARLQKLTWPTAAEAYLYKQLFVLRYRAD